MLLLLQQALLGVLVPTCMMWEPLRTQLKLESDLVGLFPRSRGDAPYHYFLLFTLLLGLVGMPMLLPVPGATSSATKEL